jgi:hypothetical protein
MLDLESLKCAIGHILVEIEQETCTTAFEIRLKRSKWVVKHKGEYLHN